MFVEQDCTIEHNGMKFSAGGAFLAECSDGKIRGVVYVKGIPSEGGMEYRKRYPWTRGCHGSVTTWHGEELAECRISFYHGNFCDMARVSFDYNGRKFVGDFCPDWSQACKVRSTK